MTRPPQPGAFIPGAFVFLLALAATVIGAAILGSIPQ